MNRQTCIDIVRAHNPFDDEEAKSCDAVLEFLAAHDRFWQRDNHVGHLTASAWVVNPERSRVLLTHHKKFNGWFQLGGHIEPGDPSLLAAALREAKEESGILAIEPLQATIFDIGHHPIHVKKEPPHVHFDIRFLLLAKDMHFVVSDESHDLGWFTLAEVGTISQSKAVLRMARKLSGGECDQADGIS